MNKTLLLNSNWDIGLDQNGNLKTVDGSYAIAQNAANRTRAFTLDMYYNQADGVPHFLTDINNKPNLAVLTSAIEKVADGTNDVARSRLVNSRIIDRQYEGNLELTLISGEVLNVSI